MEKHRNGEEIRRRDNSDFRENCIASKEDIVAMQKKFLSRIVQEGYFSKRVAEYGSRKPLTLQRPGLRTYRGNGLAICDRCDLVYEISISRDVTFEKEGDISVPYCEPCSITKTIKQFD